MAMTGAKQASADNILLLSGGWMIKILKMMMNVEDEKIVEDCRR